MSMSQCPEQPPREPIDGEVNVRWLGDNRFSVTVGHEGQSQFMVMSGYNAWRLFGALSFMLGVKLASKVAKKIQMG